MPLDDTLAAEAEAGAAPAAVGVVQRLTGVAAVDAELALSKWSALALTYSFPDSADAYPSLYSGVGNEPRTGFAPLDASMQAATTAALQTQFAAVTPLSFTLVAPGSTGVNIRSAISGAADPTAYAYYPGNGNAGGDAWYGPSLFGPGGGYGTATRGNYTWLTVLHELGHAMGLKHPHEAVAGNPTLAPADRDSMEFSVMTYASYVGASLTGGYRNEAWGYAQSLMMDDIQALQAMYGANFASHAEDTVYSFSPTTGEEFINGVGQGAPGDGIGGSANRVFLTIWDGGGTDTYDFSNYTTDLNVDLSPGGWSVLSAAQLANLGADASGVHYARGNLFNALPYNGDPRSLIENAIGGSGNDVLHGNAANNLLVGGPGNDTLDGAAGRDTAAFHDTRADTTLLHDADGSWTVTSAEGADLLRSIEVLAFSDGNLVLVPLARTDFSGTGQGALLAANDSGGVELVGASGPAMGQATLAATRDGWAVATTGDFDGDGHADILWRNADGGTWMELHDGAAAVVAAGSLGTVDASWQLAPSGDFNGDGQADLLWHHDDGDTVLWLMAGLNVAAVQDFGVVGTAWSIAGVADLNGDGRADVLWRNTDGETYLWQMDGTHITSQGLLSAAAGTDWQVRGLGDFNGDGRADILWQNSAGAVEIWLMDGMQVLAMRDLGSVDPAQWRVAEVLDANGDDTSDIAWSAPDGTVWLWTMQNGAIASQGSPAVLASGWHLLAA